MTFSITSVAHVPKLYPVDCTHSQSIDGRFAGTGNISTTSSFLRQVPHPYAERLLIQKNMPSRVALGIGLLAPVFISLRVKLGIQQDAVRQFAFASDQRLGHPQNPESP